MIVFLILIFLAALIFAFASIRSNSGHAPKARRVVSSNRQQADEFRRQYRSHDQDYNRRLRLNALLEERYWESEESIRRINEKRENDLALQREQEEERPKLEILLIAEEQLRQGEQQRQEEIENREKQQQLEREEHEKASQQRIKEQEDRGQAIKYLDNVSKSKTAVEEPNQDACEPNKQPRKIQKVTHVDRPETENLSPLTRNANQEESLNSNFPSLNSGISNLDGPGMLQRLSSCGLNGYAVYLLYSSQHNAYKVGHCKALQIGSRVKQIKVHVPDVEVIGTAVFTSLQKAFEVEQKILSDNRQFKYRGITGSHAGRTEWLTRKPPGRRPSLLHPNKVEERYRQEIGRPAEILIQPDNYTVYLVHSSSKHSYLVKWCKTENLSNKLKKLREEVADAAILSRIRIADKDAARAIAKQLNKEEDAYLRDGRRDIMKWCQQPKYLDQFKAWDKDGNRLS